MAETVEERKLRDHRRALSSVPTYSLNIAWREHLSNFRTWYLLFGISDLEFRKASLFFSIKPPAAERIRIYGSGSEEFRNSDFEEYAKLLGETFEPLAESQLSKTEFYTYKQGRNQDINSYLSGKLALFRQAFGSEAQVNQFEILLLECIKGTYNTVVKRELRRSNPTDVQSLRANATRIVANERECYTLGCAESINLDGLAATSLAYQVNVGGGVDTSEPMEIDGLNNLGAMKCYKCQRYGHMARECQGGGSVSVANPPRNTPNSTKKTGGTVTGSGSGLQKKQGGSDKDKKCFNCGRRGHLAKQCYSKKKVKVGQVQDDDDEEDDGDEEEYDDEDVNALNFLGRRVTWTLSRPW
jgi:hypothetical protein